jgi:hypothetical protein
LEEKKSSKIKNKKLHKKVKFISFHTIIIY